VGSVVAGSVASVRPAVGRLVGDVEAAIEMDVDLAAVVADDLDLVVALFVADLGPGDSAATGGIERRGLCLLERPAVDRLGGVGGPALGRPRLALLRRRLSRRGGRALLVR
jgi:hypothetical protein